MKGMKLYKKATGGYLSALEQSKPELFQTIKSYRDRLSGGEKETFDKRANIQYSATMNMPKNQRDAYIASIEKEYSKPSDVQFKQIKSSLGEKFKPTYTYIARDSDRPAATTGYYRDLSKEIEESDKKLKNLMITETEKRTRPQYEVTYPSATTYGSPRPSEMTTNLPKDAVLTRGLYGQEYLQSPIQNRTSMGQQNTNPQYRRVGDQQYTVSTTRAQRAGDKEYDKQFAAMQRLQRRHDNRFLYQNYKPSQGLTGANIYTKTGMNNTQTTQPKPFVNPYASYGTPYGTAKKGGAVKMSKGGKAAIRGKKFTGVY
jgi:hypothetical protein